MAKLLEVTISGSYKGTKETFDFDNVKGIIPVVAEDLATMHVQGRYAAPWIKAAKKKDGSPMYPERIEHMRQVFVDSIKEIEADELSYIGKDIKEMSYEELQDLATAKDLRRIPLPKELSGASIREMRQQAYWEYGAQVLGMDDNQKLNEKRPIAVERRINPMTEGYNFAKLPPMIVSDGVARRDMTQKVTNEDMIEIEQNAKKLSETPKSQLTLDDLKGIAKQKSIAHSPNIGFDALYAKIFGGEVS